jgi:hypothetical protein
MKLLSIVLLALISLTACSTNSQNIDPNTSYRSNDSDSPNVGSKAYSGAEFPEQNQLTKPAH